MAKSPRNGQGVNGDLNDSSSPTRIRMSDI
jgi:hypothetical protein